MAIAAATKTKPPCGCGNSEYGFECVCDWVKNHPGDVEFTCEYCGIYTASAPRCSKCDGDTPRVVFGEGVY